MCPNGKYVVEHKDALACPLFQIAVVWNVTAQVVIKFFVDVYK
jgi:hypothetical protein